MPRDNDVETSVERADPLVGTIFDKRFHVDERIATGGFGAIYRATHVKSGHRVALKVLLPSLARDLGIVARFRREGDTLTALRSQHTINAYELGQASDRTLFIVMELLYGESLFERYKANGPFEWKRMVKIGREVCESLEEAHSKGVVHRDLKPTNIHLEKHDSDIDYVKVLDFGIAKIIGGNEFQAADITNAGQMIGTLDYMSPEQMVGGKVTGQTDIYTLGLVMYEMIAGCTPFPEAMTAAQALAAVMKTRPDPLYLRAPVPEELDRIVMRCLERDTTKRYQNVTELRLDLARLLAGVSPDRSHVVETKPIFKPDEVTQFTPPPERLLNELRRSADFEPTEFTPPPEKILAELRTPPRRKHSPAVEWGDEDEQVSTTSRRPKMSEEQERVTKVARLSDIAAAHAADAEHEQVTKVARVSDLVAAEAHAADDNERVTNVARLSEVALRMPPRGNAADRAVTKPRDASERAVTVPRGDHDLHDRDRTQPRPRPADDDDVPGDGDTIRVRKPETLPPPIPSAARKAPGKSAPPPLPGVAPMPSRSQPTAPPAVARTSSKTQPPPSTLTPPRTFTPQNPSIPRTLTPQSPQRPLPRQTNTPVPQVVVAPFSQAPQPPGPSLPTPPGISPYAATELAMQQYTPGTQQPYYAQQPYQPAPQPMATPYGMQQPYQPFVTQPGVTSPVVQHPFGAPPPRNFDMGRIAAREATIRRFVWIIVLIVATGVGIILATQL